MIARPKLNSLVVSALKSDGSLRAVTMFHDLRVSHSDVLREERVLSFRGFVKIINSFPDVRYQGACVKRYVLK